MTTPPPWTGHQWITELSPVVSHLITDLDQWNLYYKKIEWLSFLACWLMIMVLINTVRENNFAWAIIPLLFERLADLLLVASWRWHDQGTWIHPDSVTRQLQLNRTETKKKQIVRPLYECVMCDTLKANVYFTQGILQAEAQINDNEWCV